MGGFLETLLGMGLGMEGRAFSGWIIDVPVVLVWLFGWTCMPVFCANVMGLEKESSFI